MKTGDQDNGPAQQDRPHRTPRRGLRWLKWTAGGVSALLALLLLALLLLGTTGWVLDPLLAPVLGRYAPADLPARPELDRLRIRLNHRDGLLVDAGGFRFVRDDGRAAATLAGLRLEWSAAQLWRRHWAPQAVTLTDARVNLWKNPDGAWECVPLPQAEPPAAIEPVVIPWDTIDEAVALLLPLDGHPTEIHCGPVTVVFNEAPDWPVFAIAESRFVLRRAGRDLVLESTGRALIDTHAALFGLDARFDGIKRTLAGVWSGERIDLGWTSAAARAGGFDAAVDGLVDARFEWEIALDPLAPVRIRYTIGSDGLRLDLPGSLRKPLEIAAWQLNVDFDFGTGYGSLAPFELQAGPVRVRASLDTDSDPATGAQQLRFSGGIDPFTLTEVADLLEPELAGTLQEWLEQTGGWALDHCELAGWINLDLTDPTQPKTRQAHWSFDAALLAGRELLALKAVAEWRADPFSFEVAWQVPPFRPAGIPLPPALAQFAGITDFPVGAGGITVLSGPMEVRELAIQVDAGKGFIVPLEPLEGLLGRPLQFDGMQVLLTADEGLSGFGIDLMALGWEGMQVTSTGLRVTLEEPLLCGKAQTWKLEGGLESAGMSLARLAGPLAGDLQDLIPLPTEQWERWGTGEWKWRAAAEGRLGPLLEPALTQARFELEAHLEADGLEIPVRFKAQVQPLAAAWQAALQTGLEQLDIAALLQRWPPGLLPDLRALALEYEPAGSLRTLSLEAAAVYTDGADPVEMVESIDLTARLEGLSARLPELGRVAIAGIDLAAAHDRGSMTLTRIAPEAYSGELGVTLDWSGPPLGVPTEARLTVTATAGQLKLPELWESAYSVEALDLTALLDPAMQAVKDARLKFRGSGLALAMTDLQAHPEAGKWAVSGSLEVTGADVATLLAYWPAGIEDELRTMVFGYAPSGRVRNGTLHFAADVDPAAPGPEGIRELAFRFDTGDWILTQDDWIRVDAPSVLIEGGLDTVRVDIPSVVAGPLQAESVELLIANPLGDAIGVEAVWTARLALEDLAPFIAQSPDAALRADLAPLLEPALGVLRITGTAAAALKDGTASVRATVDTPALAYGELLRSPSGARLEASLKLAMGPDEWVADTDLAGRLLLPFSARTRARLDMSEDAPAGVLRELQITALAFGKSDLAGRIAPSADASALEIRLAGECFHLDELLKVLEPMLDDFLSQPPAGTPAPGPAPAAVAAAAPAVEPGPVLDVQLDYARVQLAPGRELRDLRATARQDGPGLPDFLLTAIEGPGHTVRVSLTPDPAGPGRLQVNIPDVAGFATLCVSPLEGITLAKSPLGQNLDVIRRVPDSFSGGVLELKGLMDLDSPEALFAGSLRIDDMLMVKAPCLLRLVAGVSGKSFIEGVPFKLFAMEHFRLGGESFAVKNLQLDGPVTMNVFEGYYRFADQFIRVSGDHYLSNFMLEGPITAPKVWLDNRMTRALGTDDSDWADW